MPSYQVSGVCYASEASALAAAASMVPPASAGAGGNHFALTVTPASSGTGLTYTYTPTLCDGLACSGPATVVEVPYTPVPCQLMDIADVQPLAWGVVVAWAASYGVVFLRRVFQ